MKPLDWLRMMQTCALEEDGQPCAIHGRLKSGDLALAAGIVRWADMATLTCEASWQRLSTASRLGRRSVADRQASLEAAGWLVVTHRTGAPSRLDLVVPAGIEQCARALRAVKALADFAPLPVQNPHRTRAESAPLPVQNLHTTRAESAHIEGVLKPEDLGGGGRVAELGPIQILGEPTAPPPPCEIHGYTWDHDAPCRACGSIRRWSQSDHGSRWQREHELNRRRAADADRLGLCRYVDDGSGITCASCGLPALHGRHTSRAAS